MWRREKKVGDAWFQAVKFLFFFFGDSSHGVISGRPRRNLQVSDVLVGHEWIIVDS